MRWLITLLFMAAVIGPIASAQDTDGAPGTDDTDIMVVEVVEASDTDSPSSPVAEVPDTEDTDSPAVESVEEAVEITKVVVSAFKDGNWALGIGGLLLLLVWVTRSFFWDLFPNKALAWVTIGVEAAALAGAGLFAGVHWAEALVSALLGVLSGLGSAGVWDNLKKEQKPKS